MTSDLPVFRALVIYGICLPLAVILGYLLALPLDYTSVGFVGMVLLLLCAPLLLKWHHLLLILALNANAAAFLVPGRPKLWLVLSAISLGISVLQLTLSRRFRFLHAPSIARPLLFLAVVTVVTAKLTGGISMQIFGGQNIGGRRYLDVLSAILAYFALTAHRIPPHRAVLYGSLFFLTGATNIISSLIHFIAPSFYFIYWLFPPLELPTGEVTDSTRMAGLAIGGMALASFLAARYGLRGIFLSGKPWRAVALALCLAFILLGGYRSYLILTCMTLAIQFWLEGLVKSKLMPVAILSVLLGAAVALPFTSRLPRTFQRALSVLPVEVDSEVRANAEESSQWRIKMWQDVLPEVPKHLLLGKGYLINVLDFSRATQALGQQMTSRGPEGYEITGDYHNGPLSVVMPLGIWGVIGFAWLLWTGGRLLYYNHRYGDPAFQSINTCLFASFLALTIQFLLVYGSLYADLIRFTSFFGMSVALNGGMCKPVRAAVAEKPVNIKFRSPMKPVPEPFKA